MPELPCLRGPCREGGTALTLLFRPQHREPILSRRKTQTRRLWKKPRVKVGGLYWASTKLFDKNARFARVRVIHLWQEMVNAISDGDARAEGFASKDEFLQAFERINGWWSGAASLHPVPVWCVEFEVVPSAEAAR